MDTVEELDALVEKLDAASRKQTRVADAIDKVLASQERSSTIRSLRDHESITQFRRELGDGLIRVDTARQLLSIINKVLGAIVAGGI